MNFLVRLILVSRKNGKIFLFTFYLSLNQFSWADDEYHWRTNIWSGECAESFPSPDAAGTCAAGSIMFTRSSQVPGVPGCTGTYQSFDVDLSWPYRGYANIHVDCPGYFSAELNRFVPGTNGVSQHYIAASPVELIAVIPSDESPSNQCAGNPIVVETGAKVQREVDAVSRGKGQVELIRNYYGSTNGLHSKWHHSFDKKITFLRASDTTNVRFKSAKSQSYGSQKEVACAHGWQELKGNFNQIWVENSEPVFENGLCKIKSQGTHILTVPIVKLNPLNPYANSETVLLSRDNGSILTYVKNRNGIWVSTAAGKGQFESIGHENIEWRFKSENGDIEDYNAEGKLLSITATNGMKQELFYDASTGLLSSVKDSTGRELLFAYTGNQLSSVTVDGNKTTSYAYNSLGLITTVTRPDNTTRIYHYEDSRFPTALTGITDERGKRYATWAYDAQGRAISSEHAGGAEKTLLAFNADGSTTVTNALNKQTIYRFADIAGARRVTKVEGQPTANCVGANQDYTYTAQGWIASKTDWKGIKTTYQYNTLGQETSRTEAFGTSEARTITTEWHPTLFVKTKVTEPEKETIYSYDSNGRLLSQSNQSITL